MKEVTEDSFFPRMARSKFRNVTVNSNTLITREYSGSGKNSIEIDDFTPILS